MHRKHPARSNGGQSGPYLGVSGDLGARTALGNLALLPLAPLLLRQLQAGTTPL